MQVVISLSLSRYRSLGVALTDRPQKMSHVTHGSNKYQMWSAGARIFGVK